MSTKKMIQYILILIAIFVASNLVPYIFGIGTTSLVKGIIGKTETESEEAAVETGSESDAQPLPTPITETETEGVRINKVKPSDIPKEESRASPKNQSEIASIEKRNQDYDTKYETFYESFNPEMTERKEGIKEAIIGKRMDEFRIALAGYVFSAYGDQYEVEKVRLDKASVGEEGKSGVVTIFLKASDKKYSQKLKVTWEDTEQYYQFKAQK